MNFYDENKNKLFTGKDVQVVYINDDSDEGWGSEVVLLMELDSTPFQMLLSGVVWFADFELGFSCEQTIVEVTVNKKTFNGLNSNYRFVTLQLGRMPKGIHLNF